MSTLDSGFNFVIALAVDGSGNVYVADGNAATIYKETPGGSGYVRSSVNATGNGVSLVNGIAVDAGGTVYATASGNYTGVVRFAPNGSGGYTQLSTLGSFGRINGVALDPLGNLYVTSDPSGNVLVARIDRSDPPVLTYPTTPVSTSSAGTTLELDNIGNTALTLPVPTTGQNPSQSPYFTQSNSSTCPLVYSSSSAAGTLASGATCTEVLSYTPTVSGAVTGNLIFTDNSLNATGATQTVVETGSSLAVPNISVISQTIPQGTVLHHAGVHRRLRRQHRPHRHAHSKGQRQHHQPRHGRLHPEGRPQQLHRHLQPVLAHARRLHHHCLATRRQQLQHNLRQRHPQHHQNQLRPHPPGPSRHRPGSPSSDHERSGRGEPSSGNNPHHHIPKVPNSLTR